MAPRIHRRNLLRSAGVAVALPMLDAMHQNSRAQESESAADDGKNVRGKRDVADPPVKDGQPPKRMVIVCTTLGLHAPLLWPTRPGAGYDTTPYLELLGEHRQDFTLFNGLEHGEQLGRQPHDSEATFLTSARHPGMAGFRNSVSVDQVAASHLAGTTRFPSIALSTLRATSQSYSSGGVMIPAITSPSRLFAALFLKGTADEILKEKHRLARGHSILDGLADEARRLRKQASGSDGHMLDEYFDSIRATERDILRQQDWLESPKPKVNIDAPLDILDPADLIGKTSLLVRMIPLILQSDSSRVVTLMIQDHLAVPKVEGVAGSHHSLSHHGQNPEKIEQLRRVETLLLSNFAELLSALKRVGERGRSLLDETAVLFGSNLGNANAHDTRNLPIFLAGGGFQHGSFVQSAAPKPLCNLFVSMLQNLGLEIDQFGQSTGTLTW